MDILCFIILDLGFLGLNPGLVHAPPAPVPRSKGMPAVGVRPMGWMTHDDPSLDPLKEWDQNISKGHKCGKWWFKELMKFLQIRFMYPGILISPFATIQNYRKIDRNLWKYHSYHSQPLGQTPILDLLPRHHGISWHHGTSIRALRSAVNALDSASKPGWSHLLAIEELHGTSNLPTKTSHPIS